MDIYQSRQEIRRQALAFAGYSTDLAVSVQAKIRIDALIDASALRVASMNRWLSTKFAATTYVDQTSQFVSFRQIEQARWMQEVYASLYHPLTFQTPSDTWQPADLANAPIYNVGPAGIVEVVYWDDDKKSYQPLVRAVEPGRFSQDRVQDFAPEAQLNSIYAGDTNTETNAKVAAAASLATAQRARPYSYDITSTGIKVWPLVDKRYAVRVVYHVTPTWGYGQQGPLAVAIDQRDSLVDSLAIIYFTAAEMFAQQGDDKQSDRFEVRALERIRAIRANQSTGEGIVADTEAAFDNDYEQKDRMLPRWNLGPFLR